MINIKKIIVFSLMSSLITYNSLYAKSNILYTTDTNDGIGPGVDMYNAANTTFVDTYKITDENINNVNNNTITNDTPVIPIIKNINPTDIIYTHQGKKYIKGKSLGNFKLTGYCACTKCTLGTGITYSGKPVTDNHTVSADLSIIPLNTFIILENTGGTEEYKYDGVYQVEDKGGGVKDKHIDIYEPTHEEACMVSNSGIKYADVYEAIEIE